MGVQSTKVAGVCPTASKNKKKQLEIWGKAQRESARRPKSDWGKLEE